MRSFDDLPILRRRREREPQPRRQLGSIIKRAWEAKLEEQTARAGYRRERGLTVRHYRPDELGSVPMPRPHAGKKSKRTHARTWG